MGKKDNKKILEALQKNSYKLLDDYIYNDLYDAAILIKPELHDFKLFIQKYGYKVHMSGSGTTLFMFKFDRKLQKELIKVFDFTIFKKYKIKKRYHNCLK